MPDRPRRAGEMRSASTRRAPTLPTTRRSGTGGGSSAFRNYALRSESLGIWKDYMRAATIRVRNFRNLADISVPIEHGTVIVGENRSGKSNLSHALRLVLDPTLSSSQRTLGREDFWDGLSDGATDWDPLVAGERIEISVRIEEIDEEPQVLAALGAAIAETDPLTAELTYRFAPREDIEQPTNGAQIYDWGIYGADGQERVGTDLRRFFAHVYLGALRDAESDLRAWRRSPLKALIEEMAEEVDREDLEAIGEALNAANDQVADLQPVAELADAITNETETFVGDSQALDTTLGLTPPEPVRILRALRLYVDGAAQRPLRAASLGSLNVLYMALLELRLRRQVDRDEIAHAFINIEEPEAHLHPHTQRLVFSRLLQHDPTRTAIVTTHSPHIVSVTPPRQIVLLRSSNGSAEISSAADADLSDSEWDDIGRYLDATRGELVFARKVFLVEGFAEQVLMPLFAADQGQNLDKLGVSVCAIHGTHFTVYARLLTALGIPWVVITDGDPSKVNPDDLKGVRRAERIVEALALDVAEPAEAGIFVGQSTLEHDLYEAGDDMAEACRKALESLGVTVDHDLDADGFLRKVKSRKGRFAQRLAARHESLEAPEYVAQAINYLIAQ